MNWWRRADDGGFTPEWKKTLVGFTVSIGVVMIFAGLMILAIATLTEFTYQTAALPAEVQTLVFTSRQTGAALTVIGGGMVAIGLIARR